MSVVHGRWSNAILEPYRQIGDPVADPVIREVFARNEAETVNRMLRSIEANEHLIPAEMPDGVEDYLNQTNAWPEWADAESCAARRCPPPWGSRRAIGPSISWDRSAWPSISRTRRRIIRVSR